MLDGSNYTRIICALSQRHNLIRAVSILLLVGVTVAVAATMVRICAVARELRAVLPDGSTVECVGTTVGAAQFTTDTQWQRFARQYLPARFQNLLPAPINGWGGS